HPRGAGAARAQEPGHHPGVHPREYPAAPGQLPQGPPAFLNPHQATAPGESFMLGLSTPPAVRIVLPLALAGLLAGPAAAADPIKWRADYNTARREAQEKGLPLFIEIGTEDCFYCRKLEAVTFRDPAVAALLANGVVPLRVDANRDPNPARALKGTLYPTAALAGA